MFENIIGQGVVEALKNDVAMDALPPSLLFSGARMCGKGSGALELARVLCCTAGDGAGADVERTARWNCACPACDAHRRLFHPDMLCIGPRPFQAELRAAAALFLRESGDPLRKIFLQRAVQKLLMRFSPIVAEGDPKMAKLNKLLEDVQEDMDELAAWKDGEAKKLEKLLGAIVDHGRKLELEGVSDAIPVLQIRNCSYWLRLTPGGKRKVLIIENAEKMNDSARNSLLKILEEPPERASIILTSSKPDALPPTVLSRLRKYAFVKRSAETEAAVVSRVFRDAVPGVVPDAVGAGSNESLIARYLDAFLPVPAAALSPAAAYFLASLASGALKEAAGGGGGQELLAAIGARSASFAKERGFGAPAADIKTLCAAVRAAAGKFETRGMYGVFLEKLCAALSQSLASGAQGAQAIAYRGALAAAVEESKQAVEVYNQNIELALERLAFRLSGAFSKAGVCR
ncbi:MAG: DNA polymerase III [Spirochaetaceae bacterium]|jgi:DNA polymerase-3 subunit gamma/tau|nr:DNA polymerase III [Spirochaetaceae bacterium]